MTLSINNWSSVAEAAREYAHEGIRVVPLQPDSKKPLGPYKDQPRISEEAVDAAFAGAGCGVAAALGKPSAGLCDVDCDWSEAASIAAELLGSPSFMRAGSAGSHHLFVCEDSNKADENCRLVKYELPNMFDRSDARLPAEHSLCVLELRGNGQL